MKKLRRILSVLLSVCLIATMFASVGTASTLTASASGTNMLRLSGTDWMWTRQVINKSNFEVGAQYRFSINYIPRKLGSDTASRVRIRNKSNYNATRIDGTTIYTVTFTFQSGDDACIEMLTRNTNDDLFFGNPSLYKLDASGNTTGSNLVLDPDFATDINSTSGSTAGNPWYYDKRTPSRLIQKAGYFDYDPEVNEMLVMRDKDWVYMQQEVSSNKFVYGADYRFEMEIIAVRTGATTGDRFRAKPVNSSGNWINSVPTQVPGTNTYRLDFTHQYNSTSGTSFQIWLITRDVDDIYIYGNPRLYKMENGSPVGENLILDPGFHTGINNDTCTSGAYPWYTDNKGSALKGGASFVNQPENYFSATDLPESNMLHVQTTSWAYLVFEPYLSPNRSYRLSYNCNCQVESQYAGTLSLKYRSSGGSVTALSSGVGNRTDTKNGYLSTIKFTMPSDSKTSGTNLKITFVLGDDVDNSTYLANFELYEVNANGDILSGNLLPNGGFYGETGVVDASGSGERECSASALWGYSFDGAGFVSARVMSIPEGFFNADIVVDNPRMLALGGYGGEEALHIGNQLTAGETYQFDIDYRACGGINALIKTEYINSSNETKEFTSSNAIWKTDTGTHISLRFTMPSDIKTNADNFEMYLGKQLPIKRNGIVYFANASLYKVENNQLTGLNLYSNGDFRKGPNGVVTYITKDIAFFGWDQLDVMSYTSVEVMDIPEGFFTDDKNLELDKVYEFKGGDTYKPQFNFQFTANTTYRLTYDYSCADGTCVNAYILAKDNSVTAVKNRRTTNGKFQATYTITADSTCKSFDNLQSANGSIRFALNGNTYESAFTVGNIKIYKVENEAEVGANLVYSLNPIYDDEVYDIEDDEDECEFALAKDDSNCASQKTDIATGWLGELDYDGSSTQTTYSKIIKSDAHLFDYFEPSERLTKLISVILDKVTGYNPYTDTNSRFYDPNNDTYTNILDLVKIKKDIANGTDKFSVANEQTNGGIYSDISTVACYGDSLTQGMGYDAPKTYPGRLSAMLGSNYTVYNSGDPGERTYTIMARQGALSLTTTDDISFSSGVAQVQIGNADDNGFITSTGDYINLTGALGNERKINDVIINGDSYQVVITDFVWEPRSYNVHLKRTDTSGAVTIPKGSNVTFNATTKQDECDIYFMGANGVFHTDDDLIAQFKAMVDNHGSNNYLIVTPYWRVETKFREAFGDHYVSFREAAIEYGLSYENITPSAGDLEAMENGQIPLSLRYYPNIEGDSHLNDKGYDFLAHILYEQGKTLEIFN